MLTKTKTLIDKYTNVLVVTGLLLVIVVTLSGGISLSFSKKNITAKAAAPEVTTENGDSPYNSISAMFLNGTYNSPDSAVTSAGFEWGIDTSYGNTAISYTYNMTNNYLTGWTGNSNPYGVAVDSAGNVFVSQSGSSKIEKFSNVGNPLSQFGSAGSGNGQFSSVRAIAIDSSDNIYVADSGNNRIQKFNSSGTYLSQFGSAGSGNGQFNTPTGVALDSSGNIYVADTGNQRIQKFNSSGTYLSQFGSAGSGNGQFANPTNLAVSTTGTIYVSDNLNNRIQVFNSSGVYQSQFGNGVLYSPNGIAIGNLGQIYVADTGNNRIRIFNNLGVLISQITGANNTPGLAFGPNNYLYASSFALNSIYKYQSYAQYNQNFNSSISNLSCNTTYHFRAYATNADGTSYGEDQTYIIPCMKLESNDVQSDGNNWNNLVLKGITYDTSSDISARGFQWGTTTGYGNALYDTGTPPFPLGEYSLSSNLFNCDTTYHMRAYATNSQGTYYGNDYEFSFPCMQINNDGADTVTDATANLIGDVSYSNGDVTARGFEYGIDTSYGNTITDPATPPYSDLPFTYNLTASNLTCNTTYHFRPYATNSHGTFYGDDDTFTTLGCTNVNTLPASSVVATSALLNGDVTETLSSIIGQGFQLGTSTSYGTNVAYTPSDTTIGYKSTWGSRGSGDGQFINPEQLAKDSLSNIYVADAGNNRIQKFDASGNYLGQFGSYGSGNGEFDYPSGVVVADSGNIYVADCGNSRVQIFDSSFNYLGQFGISGSGDGEFNCAWNIALDTSGNVYVTDYGNHRAQKFSNIGNYIGQFGGYGSGDGQLDSPLGIYVSNNDNIYVADSSNSRVQIFDSSFNYLSQFGSYGTGNGQFHYPYAITMNGSGKLYVSDEGSGQARVQIFDASGNYISQFGSYGTGDGQFIQPEGIVADNSGNIYVSSWSGFPSEPTNIQVFGPVPVYSTGPYSSQASGLACGTTYHYRAYVTNAGGTYYGADQTFNTQGCPYVPSSTKPTATVSTTPAPLIDLGVFTAIGRTISLPSAPGGILGYIYRFLQALPHNVVVALPYLLILLLLIVALTYGVQAWRDAVLAGGYKRQSRRKQNALDAQNNLYGAILAGGSEAMKNIKKALQGTLKAGLINKFELSAITASMAGIAKQIQVSEWAGYNHKASLVVSNQQQSNTGKILRGFFNPLMWAPVLILGLVLVGLDLMLARFGIATVGANDIKIQIALFVFCTAVVALVWLRVVRNRIVRENASDELSAVILLMQANGTILSSVAEKSQMEMDEINSIVRKIAHKDEAKELLANIKTLAGLLAGYKAVEVLNRQETKPATSAQIKSELKEILDNNKRAISAKKLMITKAIPAGLKIGLSADLIAVILKTNLENALEIAEKNGKIDIKFSQGMRNVSLSITSGGKALSRRMLHALEGPISNSRKLDAVGAGLYLNQIIVESVGGKFNISSDSKTGTYVKVKLPKSNEDMNNFKPNKELDNPELAPFGGKVKPA